MKKVKTYLEFGYQKGKNKVPRDTRYDQEAYDFFMVSRYLKDIIAYRTGKIENVHHKEDINDNLKKYAALSACKNFSQPLVYYEIGSSLMGVIDSLEYINKKLGELNIKDISFVGVDNSKMMNSAAYYLHENYRLKLSEKKAIVPCHLFFSKGVSLLYAFNDEKLFCDILKKCKIAIFDYTFSLRKGSIKSFVGTGKSVTYLNLEKCKKLLRNSNKKLILQPSKRKHRIPEGTALYECIFGEERVIQEYTRKIKKFSNDIKKSKKNKSKPLK